MNTEAKIRELVRVVCKELDVKQWEMYSKSRKAKHVRARQLCVYFMRTKLKLSTVYLGELFFPKNNTGHSNVVYIEKRIKKLRVKDDSLFKMITDIENALDKCIEFKVDFDFNNVAQY